MINKAIKFAANKHNGQNRKGKNVPYIVHSLEVFNILYRMGADEDLLVAGLLHDVLEDTDTKAEELQAEFGTDVMELVMAHTEDKSLPWQERKKRGCEALAQASKRVQMLVLADKLSNIREMAQDYKAIGDKLWQRFNRGYDMQAWYYNYSVGFLQALAEDEKTAWAYDEYCETVKSVFGKVKCPMCGKYTFEEVDDYDVCQVCGWENEDFQYRTPDFAGGANDMSLNQAREAYKRGEKVY